MLNLDDRKEVARQLLSSGLDELDMATEQADPDALPSDAVLTADLGLTYPDGLAPVPQPLDEAPDREDPITEQADVLVIPWTVAELNGLADVLTPGSAAGDGTTIGTDSIRITTRSFATARRPRITVVWAAGSRRKLATRA